MCGFSVIYPSRELRMVRDVGDGKFGPDHASKILAPIDYTGRDKGINEKRRAASSSVFESYLEGEISESQAEEKLQEIWDTEPLPLGDY